VEKRLTCACGHEIAVRPDSTATSLDCPACGRELTIPTDEPAPAPGDEPAAQDDEAQAQTGGDAREPCPFCLELILPGARKCPFCQEYLDASIAPQPEQEDKAPEPQAPKTRTSGLALASLAMGIAAPFLCFLTAPPAIFLGVAGYLATRNPRVRGRATAIAGLLLGLLWVAAGVGFIFLMSQVGGTLPGGLGQPTDPYLF